MWLVIICYHVTPLQVRKEYKKLIRRSKWLPECVRVKYGGHRSSTYTPNQTTSSGNVSYLLSLLQHFTPVHAEAQLCRSKTRLKSRSCRSRLRPHLVSYVHAQYLPTKRIPELWPRYFPSCFQELNSIWLQWQCLRNADVHAI